MTDWLMIFALLFFLVLLSLPTVVELVRPLPGRGRTAELRER